MTARAEQRDETRERIIDAAVDAFSELGFRAASTRDVAKRAGVTQGLVTYHFGTKDALWRAAADRIFTALQGQLAHALAEPADDPADRARDAIRAYVRFVAAHPALFRFMVDEGRHGSERMQWLVDTHVTPLFGGLQAMLGELGVPADDVAHLYYVIAGAGSLMFAVAPECRRLTGVDPAAVAAVDRHADLLARLLIPEA